MDLRAKEGMGTKKWLRLTGCDSDMAQAGCLEHIEGVLCDLLKQLVPRNHTDPQQCDCRGVSFMHAEGDDIYCKCKYSVRDYV